MEQDIFKTNLDYRKIERGQDTDYFIETLSYPVNLNMPLPYMSRIQFPKSRAVLIRTSPHTADVTIHIMRDIDLYSSFANFEVKLTGEELKIWQSDGQVEINIQASNLAYNLDF